MNLLKKNQVLVLTFATMLSTILWTYGCAGFAEPVSPLSITPNALSVSAKVGTASSQTVSVTNIGTAEVSVSQAIINGAGFSVTGLMTPLSLAVGQSKSFTVKFDSPTVGSINGSLTIMTDARHRPVVLSLHGNAGSSNPAVESVAISPAAATPAPGAKVLFTAKVQGTTSNDSVTWTTSMGTITANGVYTAPGRAASGTVTATSVADPTKSASAVVTVTTVSTPVPAPTPTPTPVSPTPTPPTPAPTSPAVSSVSISPANTSATTGGTISFTATVVGSTSNKSVTWQASSGNITSGGFYTAPSTPGTSVVTATSVADPTKAAAATITVTAPPPPAPAPAAPTVTSVTVSPGAASSIAGGTLSFKATVQGTTTNTSVTWTAVLGSITSSGAYTAPAKAGSDTVTATSVADTTKSGSATVTVTAPAAAPVVTSIAVSPTSTSATTGGTVQFSATVQGTVTDKSVTWTAALGSITSSGAYTAPAKAGTDTVTATSNADTTKFASASVTVTAPAPAAPTPPAPAPTASCGGSGCPAFPGAEGGGATSVGGRGGVVIEVTNNNDSGTGSFRACVNASGPRTCVFRVAGLFPITSGDIRFSSPYLTVAGQTAPGEVILGGPNTGGALFGVSTHDVILRYVTLSPDNFNTVSGPDTGTTSIWIVNCPGNGTLTGGNGYGCYNIMVDHVTTRWSGNKSWITTSNFTPGLNGNGNGDGPNFDMTTQWTLDYEPHEGHPVGYGTATDESCVSTVQQGACLSNSEVNIDFHHDMFVNVDHRIPENENFSTRWINNIIFNWGYYANEWLGAETIDAINNKYITGNLNALGAQAYPIHFTTNSPEMSGAPSVYVAGNIFGPPGTNTVNSDQYGQLVNEITGENGDETGPIPSSWERGGPMAASNSFPIVPDPAANLDSIMLATVGNSQHLDCNGNWVSHRDSADQRIISQYQNGGSGGYWPNGVTFTGLGLTSANTPTADWQDAPVVNGTACVESMHDGIPDAWKQAKGLSLSDPNLYNTVAPNGYTWLENYLNAQ